MSPWSSVIGPLAVSIAVTVPTLLPCLISGAIGMSDMLSDEAFLSAGFGASGSFSQAASGATRARPNAIVREMGRGSCRASVCQCVELLVVAGSLKKQQQRGQT